MPNLRAVEIKAFVPSMDFELSKQFYEDLGFIKASDANGVAYFHHGDVSFLLQDYYAEDVEAWWNHVHQTDLSGKYSVAALANARLRAAGSERRALACWTKYLKLDARGGPR